MKKVIRGVALILPLVFISACFLSAKAMEVTYNMRTSSTLKDYTVYLVVEDHRDIANLVGRSALEKNLFPELSGGRFDLVINMPGRNRVSMTNLTAVEAVTESAGRRLKMQGVTPTSHRAAAQLTVEIHINDMNIDLMESDLMATVELSSSIYRDSSQIIKSNARVTSNRMKLIGGTGGATVLSEALSQAMNDLDLSGINKF